MSENRAGSSPVFFPLRMLPDFLTALLAFVIAYALRFTLFSRIPAFSAPFGPPGVYFGYGILFALIVVIYLAFVGLYDRIPLFVSARMNALAYFNAAAFATIGVLFTTYTFKMLDPSRLVLGLGWVLASWLLWWKDSARAPAQHRISGAVHILGGGEFADLLEKRLHGDYPNLVIRRFPEDIVGDEVFVRSLHDHPPLALLYLLKYEPESRNLRKVLALSQKLSFAVKIIPEFPILIPQPVSFEDVSGLPLMSPRSLYASFSGQVFKRLVDYVLGGMILIVTLPVFAVIAGAIKLQSPGPVFYFQERIGRSGKPFKLWKFRTMRKDAEKLLKDNPELAERFADKFKLQSDPRVTSMGRVLRKTSLDELPQIFNVLMGQMSLVGPRPIVADELPKYGEWADLFLSVKPGLTGLWQVSGRTDLPYEKRVELDVYYIENWSPMLDLKILLLTFPAVLTSRGAY